MRCVVGLQPVQHDSCLLHEWDGAVSAGPSNAVGVLRPGADHLMGEAAVRRQLHSAHGGRNHSMSVTGPLYCLSYTSPHPAFSALTMLPTNSSPYIAIGPVCVCLSVSRLGMM